MHVFNRFPEVRRIYCQLYLCRCPLSRGSRQHSSDTDQHQARCSQNRLYHRLWGRRETSTLLLPLFFWALRRDQRWTTFAGVGAVCVQTVLIFLTGRWVSGALVHIWWTCQEDLIQLYINAKIPNLYSNVIITTQTHRHKLLRHLPSSLLCIHYSPDWLLPYMFCRTCDILQEACKVGF